MFELPLLVVIVVLVAILFILFSKVSSLRGELSDVRFRKDSQSVKYGKAVEQWIPFADDFPFNSASFRFLGSPIDGVAFDENEIDFIEFKTGSSRLNDKQKQIKELIQNKKVKWFELRVE